VAQSRDGMLLKIPTSTQRIARALLLHSPAILPPSAFGAGGPSKARLLRDIADPAAGDVGFHSSARIRRALRKPPSQHIDAILPKEWLTLKHQCRHAPVPGTGSAPRIAQVRRGRRRYLHQTLRG
jgi:hypothetical protein